MGWWNMKHLGPGAQTCPNPHSVLKKIEVAVEIPTTSLQHTHTQWHLLFTTLHGRLRGVSGLLSLHTHFFGRRKSQGLGSGEKGTYRSSGRLLQGTLMRVPTQSCWQSITCGVTALNRCPRDERLCQNAHYTNLWTLNLLIHWFERQ